MSSVILRTSKNIFILSKHQRTHPYYCHSPTWSRTSHFLSVHMQTMNSCSPSMHCPAPLCQDHQRLFAVKRDKSTLYFQASVIFTVIHSVFGALYSWQNFQCSTSLTLQTKTQNQVQKEFFVHKNKAVHILLKYVHDDNNE